MAQEDQLLNAAAGPATLPFIRETDVATSARWPIGLSELRRARKEGRIRFASGCRTYWYRPGWIDDFVDRKTEGPPCP